MEIPPRWWQAWRGVAQMTAGRRLCCGPSRCRADSWGRMLSSSTTWWMLLGSLGMDMDTWPSTLHQAWGCHGTSLGNVIPRVGCRGKCHETRRIPPIAFFLRGIWHIEYGCVCFFIYKIYKLHTYVNGLFLGIIWFTSTRSERTGAEARELSIGTPRCNHANVGSEACQNGSAWSTSLWLLLNSI